MMPPEDNESNDDSNNQNQAQSSSGNSGIDARTRSSDLVLLATVSANQAPMQPQGLEQAQQVQQLRQLETAQPIQQGAQSEQQQQRVQVGESASGGVETIVSSQPRGSDLVKLKNQKKMVHEINPQAARGQGVVVNSTSLEDVPLSEASDRAQSIQSLHSASDTPTPDGAPSFDELQQRLDEYNRHIEQMNIQKNQLKRMQNDARQHLMLLEQYQQDHNDRSLSFGEKIHGDLQPPNYESVDDVKSDMANLSLRCDNITRLISSQRELIDKLSADGNEDLRADLHADQLALEDKLKILKKEGQGLLVMASELDTLNSNATRRAVDAVVSNELTQPESERVVPIRITTNDSASLKAIDQKEAEIDAMKTQLRRLKEMMNTIESIENKAKSGSIQAGEAEEKKTDNSTARNVPIKRISGDSNVGCDVNIPSHADDDDEHERTPTPRSSMREADLQRNLRILHGVSSDVRAQSERMVVEKERIMALQNEISRCSQQAAAAARLGEDALKRNSVTPTPSFPSSLQQHEAYEKPNDEVNNVRLANNQKEKENCKRIQENIPHTTQKAKETVRQQSVSQPNNAQNDVSPRKIENIDINDVPTRNVEGLGNNETSSFSSRGPNLQDCASADASNMQQSNGSGAHAFSIPPPIATIGTIGGGGITWGGPHNWNYQNFRYTHPTSLISPTCAFPPPPTTFAAPPFVPVPPPPVSLPTAANGLFYSSPNSTFPESIPPANNIDSIIQAINHLNNRYHYQQREIENLKGVTIRIQDYIIHGEPIIHASNIGVGLRSESVPATFTSPGAFSRPPLNIAHNIFPNSSNRAQSEQPITNLLEGQYQHEQHQFLQQQQHIIPISKPAFPAQQLQQQQQQQMQYHADSSTASGSSSSMYSTLGRNIPSQVQFTSGTENNPNLRRMNEPAHAYAQASNDIMRNPEERGNHFYTNFNRTFKRMLTKWDCNRYTLNRLLSEPSFVPQNVFAPNLSESDVNFPQQELYTSIDDNASGKYRSGNPRLDQVAYQQDQRLRHEDPNSTIYTNPLHANITTTTARSAATTTTTTTIAATTTPTTIPSQSTGSTEQNAIPTDPPTSTSHNSYFESNIDGALFHHLSDSFIDTFSTAFKKVLRIRDSVIDIYRNRNPNPVPSSNFNGHPEFVASTEVDVVNLECTRIKSIRTVRGFENYYDDNDVNINRRNSASPGSIHRSQFHYFSPLELMEDMKTYKNTEFDETRFRELTGSFFDTSMLEASLFAAEQQKQKSDNISPTPTDSSTRPMAKKRESRIDTIPKRTRINSARMEYNRHQSNDGRDPMQLDALVEEEEEPLEPENPLSSENIDSLGACSLAAQQHLQKTTYILESIPESEESDEEDIKAGRISPDKEYTSGKPKTNTRDWNLLIDYVVDRVMERLNEDLGDIEIVNGVVLELVAQITANVSDDAYVIRCFPRNRTSLILLSPKRWKKMISCNTKLPIPFKEFMPWYEMFLRSLLAHKSDSEKTYQPEIPRWLNAPESIEFGIRPYRQLSNWRTETNPNDQVVELDEQPTTSRKAAENRKNQRAKNKGKKRRR